MRKVKTTDAVGLALCHDVTKIIPGGFKGAAFKKGHIVRPQDIEELLNLGKEHLFVWEGEENSIHENDAAEQISRAIAGRNTELTEPREGKIHIRSTTSGLLKIHTEALQQINDIEEVAVATRHNNSSAEKGHAVAGCRVIPLVIEKEKVEIVEAIGCVMYHKATVFDVVLPRIAAGEKVTRSDITRLGHGGLCLECPDCRYPHCSFGKG